MYNVICQKIGEAIVGLILGMLIVVAADKIMDTAFSIRYTLWNRKRKQVKYSPATR